MTLTATNLFRRWCALDRLQQYTVREQSWTNGLLPRLSLFHYLAAVMTFISWVGPQQRSWAFYTGRYIAPYAVYSAICCIYVFRGTMIIVILTATCMRNHWSISTDAGKPLARHLSSWLVGALLGATCSFWLYTWQLLDFLTGCVLHPWRNQLSLRAPALCMHWWSLNYTYLHAYMHLCVCVCVCECK